jgi:hypothetical protein
MHIIYRISDENRINLNMTPTDATYGILRSTLSITLKMVASRVRRVCIVMAGLRTIFTQNRISQNPAKQRENVEKNTVHFTIMKKTNANLLYLMNSFEFSLKSDK